jgi:hypothetical protein
LRFLLALILVANVAFFGWTRDWLGLSSLGDREPDRMRFSYQPDAVEFKPVNSTVTAKDRAACLESGPYASAEVSKAEVALATVAPAGLWANLRQERPGVWVVYMGPFPDKESLARKEPEVKRTKVPFEVIRERGDLDFGFILGRFGRFKEADEAQAKLSDQAALRSAHVVNLVQSAAFHVLRVQAASPALAQRLALIKGSVLKPFGPCPRA